ncbi:MULTISPECIES: NfeD family protein [Franconibacter]|uniref:Membrane protein n=1 Tax=Franconibacter pulveris TaxID=435910 RepID=A0A0J8VUR8_9ENTR|nr:MULTISPECIES: NfeD family protein [Franconibacter]KMV36205.1 membrane protein [Franconibacter pulveris]MCK1967124.1 NfeD family protein [Franconibacter sp. IITDAS19]MEB5921470.1 NfeD family protein [Franconibacter daqui]GGD08845.1 membrane protein [Franconibacter daqui]
MIALFFEHPYAFWLSLGGLLLAAEMLGASGYLLWSGVAAVVTGLLVWLLPFSWEWQGLCFAVLTVLAALLWWRWLARRPQPRANAALNQRGQQLIGQRLQLDAPLSNGHGHVRVGDSSWPVIANEDMPAGALVEVIAVEGIRLRVRRLTQTPPAA